MSLREYLKDRRNLIAFFTILMVFIGGMTLFDSSIRMLKSNAEYLITVSFLLFIIYLAIDYSLIRFNMNKIRNIPKEGLEWIHSLPCPRNYEQKFYLDVINNLYESANIKIERLVNNNNERVEFLITWVHEIKTPIAASKLIIENNLSSENEKALYGIEMEIENLDVEVDTDYKWLEFIIKQILDNAIKYTPKDGIINIYTKVQEKEKVLYIKDNGIGIKKEDIGRVFEKSFTGYNGRVKRHSTGMGLYISQKLAGKLGHYIAIESEYERGAEVSIHFPKLNKYIS
ncbi:sensor histidine kinase [Clostridium autoethanogenum]|uniref:histidine kinase n=1 Tax=Clostridium autoethanogenum TaxID=84023 RepID=A0A3M0SKD7_9CLOT|nr:sensor histidine kinase [Clostridium autoethanogenum]RMC98893.1 sensor histidine kinase [Clostridium autoethanogenum]